MGVPTWDEYLFQTHKVVAVDPWCGTSLTLLDVFTREGGYGIFNRGSLLGFKGALTWLGGPEPSSAEVQKNLEEARLGRGRHCQSEELAPVYATLTSSSKISASLGSIVSMNHIKSKKLSAETSTVESKRIKMDFLIEQVQGGRWKPDPSSSLMPKNWDRVLWVVTEIFYVRKLVVAKTVKEIQRAIVDASKLVACAEPLPVNLKGGVEVSKAEDGTTVFQVSGSGVSFPIGFKVIRLLYGENGDLLSPGGIELDIARNHRPMLRSSLHLRHDPDQDPDYQMKDFFKQGPEGSLEALPLIVPKEAEEASTSTD